MNYKGIVHAVLARLDGSKLASQGKFGYIADPFFCVKTTQKGLTQTTYYASGETMEPSLVSQGTELMLYGMGTVFVFLTILVMATTLMSSLVQRFFKAPPPAPAARPAAPGPAAHQDDTLIAVISAAIQKHRSRHK